MDAGTALREALWPYVEELGDDVDVPDDSRELLAAAYGPEVLEPGRAGSRARAELADDLGLPRGGRGSSHSHANEARRARQSFLEAARRWARGAEPSLTRGQFRKVAARARERITETARTALDTLSAMVSDAGLIIRQVVANLRVSEDERLRSIKLGENVIELEPDELELKVGPGGEDFYEAIEGGDWETAALVVSTAFMDKYTGGRTGGYVTFLDDVDLLDVEIP